MNITQNNENFIVTLTAKEVNLLKAIINVTAKKLGNSKSDDIISKEMCDNTIGQWNDVLNNADTSTGYGVLEGIISQSLM